MSLEDFEMQQRGGKGKLAVSFRVASRSTAGGGHRKTEGAKKKDDDTAMAAEQQQKPSPSLVQSTPTGAAAEEVAHFFTCNDHDSILFMTNRYVASAQLYLLVM